MEPTFFSFYASIFQDGRLVHGARFQCTTFLFDGISYVIRIQNSLPNFKWKKWKTKITIGQDSCISPSFYRPEVRFLVARHTAPHAQRQTHRTPRERTRLFAQADHMGKNTSERAHDFTAFDVAASGVRVNADKWCSMCRIHCLLQSYFNRRCVRN